MKKIIIIPIYFLFFFYGYGQKISEKKQIINTWYSTARNKYSITYSNKKHYQLKYDQKTLLKGKYKIQKSNDTLWLIETTKDLTYIGESKSKVKSKFAIQINGDYLTKVSYKSGENIYNHIDEYITYVKNIENPQKKTSINKITKYYFPKDFAGPSWIAYNQPDGIPPEFDGDGNPILIIPANGILKTTIKEDAIATSFRSYEIYFYKTKDNLEKLKCFDKSDIFESLDFQNDSTIASMCGFNQFKRQNINKIFEQVIIGNVITIYIGPYKNLLEQPMAPWVLDKKESK